MSKLFRSDAPSGSALISTLLAVVVLTIIVTAFLQSMTTERQTAQSYLNRTRADLAAQTGLNVFLLTATTTMNNGAFTVVKSGDYVFGGQSEINGGTGTAFRPFFSTASTVEDTTKPLARIADNTLPIPNLTGDQVIIESAQRDGTDVTVSWTNIPDPSDPSKIEARFAYWVSDLSGSVNAQIAGNIRDNGNHQRDDGLSLDEVALYSVFDSALSEDNGSTDAQKLIEARPLLLTDSTIQQVMSQPSDVDGPIASLISAKPGQFSRNLIPGALGYVDAGRPKYNLNHFVQNQDVDGLAAIITRNLPQFATIRQGGFSDTGDDYAKTIAASIIDYADTDTTPTVGTDYRGVDSSPFITVFYDKFDWQTRSTSVGIIVTTFIQIWNLSDQPTEAGTIRLVNNNKDELVGVPNGDFSNPGNIATGALDMSLPIESLEPNEIRVIEMPPVTYSFPAGGTVTSSKLQLNQKTHSRGSFEFYWNGELVTKTPGKMERPEKTIDYRFRPDWTGGLPSLRHDPYTTNASQQPLGDPRAAYYMQSRISANNYEERNSWWGMAMMRANRYVADPSRWPDPAPIDPINNAASWGRPAYTDGSDIDNTGRPSEDGPLANQPQIENAPAHISNTGEYESATELGNIYDPGLWRYPFRQGRDIDARRSLPDSKFGGGITLRIGSFEVSRFDQLGARATQLLDLFDVDELEAGEEVTPTQQMGKININTADEASLRALLAGITITEDQSEEAGDFDIKKESPVANFFVDAVEFFRQPSQSNKFFRSPAELSGLKDEDGAAIFGETTSLSTEEKTPPETLRDEAREAMFAKIYNLISTDSRNFRVHVIGQAMGPTGKPVSTIRKVFDVRFDTNETSPATATPEPTVYYESAL